MLLNRKDREREGERKWEKKTTSKASHVDRINKVCGTGLDKTVIISCKSFARLHRFRVRIKDGRETTTTYHKRPHKARYSHQIRASATAALTKPAPQTRPKEIAA